MTVKEVTVRWRQLAHAEEAPASITQGLHASRVEGLHGSDAEEAPACGTAARGAQGFEVDGPWDASTVVTIPSADKLEHRTEGCLAPTALPMSVTLKSRLPGYLELGP